MISTKIFIVGYKQQKYTVLWQLLFSSCLSLYCTMACNCAFTKLLNKNDYNSMNFYDTNKKRNHLVNWFPCSSFIDAFYEDNPCNSSVPQLHSTVYIKSEDVPQKLSSDIQIWDTPTPISSTGNLQLHSSHDQSNALYTNIMWIFVYYLIKDGLFIIIK